MSLVDRVVRVIIRENLVESGSTVVIGLSGGPDSIFLLHVLCALREPLNIRLIAVHLDHEWRAESARDAVFCAQVCAHLQVHFVGVRASELNLLLRKTRSKEDQGRQMRRTLFERVREQYGASAIVLAHHADDQLETFFVRLARGAMVSGLACMRAKTGFYIRPLLNIYKTEILQYLQENKINYVTDVSNESMQFLRNRIRQYIIPVLPIVDVRFASNIQRVIGHMQETDAFFERLVIQACAGVIQEHNNQKVLDIKKFFTLDLFLQKQVLVNWLISHQVPFVLSEGLIKEIMRFLRNKKSASHVFNNWRLLKNKSIVSICSV